MVYVLALDMLIPPKCLKFGKHEPGFLFQFIWNKKAAHV